MNNLPRMGVNFASLSAVKSRLLLVGAVDS